MKRVYLTFAALIVALSLLRAGQDEGIVFLQLRLADDRLTLVKQSRTHGSLKQPRRAAEAHPVTVDMVAANGELLWKTSMPDPTIRRLEYEDPDRPGQLKVREITLTNVEFMVRVPAHPKGHAVVLSRAGDARAKGASRRELGRVVLERAPEE